MKSDNLNNYTKLPVWLKSLVALSIVIACISVGMYLNNFGNDLSEKQEVWGQFGDYIGGTLNPLFALTALLALIYTIVLQSKELRNSAIQLEKSAEALNNQNRVLENQNIEATFFKLLNVYSEIVKELHINSSDYDGFEFLAPYRATYDDRKCIEMLCTALYEHHLSNVVSGNYTVEEEEAVDIEYRKFYSIYGSLIGHYFRTIYNIIKFIDRSNTDLSKKQLYVNLLRAQFSRHEFVLLFYNCLSSYGRERMAPLVKKYNLLKHLENDALISEGHFELL